MPLFAIDKSDLKPVEQRNFATERELQRLVEGNLGTVFRCRLVASEFPTGSQHGGRIDTLALSEDNNPVIIEYKKVASSELVNQSLYYLSWIHDHRGDFEIAVQRVLGPKVMVDWSDIRVICLAPNYKKFDLHAVQMMSANIELWTYRRFVNNTLFLEEVLQKSYGMEAGDASEASAEGKNPVMVAAGHKAALTRAQGGWTFEGHLEGKPDQIALAVQEFVRGLDPAIEESPKKLYVAYRTSQNILCMELQKSKVTLFLKLRPADVTMGSMLRDVSEIGHFGTGDVEATLKSLEDVEAVKPLIQQAYEKVGS